MLDAANEKAKSLVTANSPPQAVQAARQLIAQNAEKGAMDKSTLQTAASERATQSVQRQAQEYQLLAAQKQAAAMAAYQNGSGSLPPGTPAIRVGNRDVPIPAGVSPEQVEKLGEIATAHSVVSKGIDKLKELVKSDPNALRTGLGTAEKRRALGVDDIIANYGAAQGHTQGSPEPVLERFTEALKPGAYQSQADMLSVLSDLQDNADNGADSRFAFHRLPGPGASRRATEQSTRGNTAQAEALK